jgi:RHS repeat-associated protein
VLDSGGTLGADTVSNTGVLSIGRDVASGCASGEFLIDDLRIYAGAIAQQGEALSGLSCRYTYGLDLISQTRLEGGTPETWYYGYDGHGSVRYLADESGAVTDTYTYDAFGIQIAQSGSATPNNYRYTGEQWDQDLGMYYLRARYYQPQTGRFWTMDTFEGNSQDPLSLHKYLYAADNPVNNTDPSGNETLIGVSIASTIGTSLHAMYDGGALAVQQAMQHTIFGVQAGKSMGDVLTGYYKEVAIGIGIGVVAGKLLSKLDDIMYGGGFFRGKPSMCFVGDTEIATEAGLKRIDQIKEGDYVWSWNENTRTTSLQKVIAMQSNVVDHVIRLVASGSSIETTDEHPFWVAGKGWTRAANLAIGDGLISISGQTNLLEQCSVFTNEVRVFNFEVEGGHTYFVSDNRILVHNACAWGTRSATLPEKSGVYILELKGKVYVGKARDIRDRLVRQKHPHSDIAQHPDAQIAVVEVDVSHLKNVVDQDRALKVIETDIINSMGSMKPNGLNETIPLSPASREMYRENLKPVVIDYQEY